MNKMDKKTELLKKIQAELERRTLAEEEAVRLISSGEHEKACALLEMIDNETIREIERELDALEQEEMPDMKPDCIAEGFVIEISHRSESGLIQICKIYTEKTGRLSAADCRKNVQSGTEREGKEVKRP